MAMDQKHSTAKDGPKNLSGILTTSFLQTFVGSWQRVFYFVVIDERADKSIPAHLSGDKSNHMLYWDGKQWFDHGACFPPPQPKPSGLLKPSDSLKASGSLKEFTFYNTWKEFRAAQRHHQLVLNEQHGGAVIHLDGKEDGVFLPFDERTCLDVEFQRDCFVSLHPSTCAVEILFSCDQASDAMMKLSIRNADQSLVKHSIPILKDKDNFVRLIGSPFQSIYFDFGKAEGKSGRCIIHRISQWTIPVMTEQFPIVQF